MAITITAARVFGPESPGGTGRAGIDIDGVTGTVGVSVFPNPPGISPPLQSFTTESPGTFPLLGLPAGADYFVAVGVFAPYATAVLAIPAYAPPPAPTLESEPRSPAAAFLPLPFTLRADPVYQDAVLTPAVLLLVVEVRRGAAWVEVGKAREVCDADGYARFEVSEYVHPHFAKTPPDESGGPDPALALQYRVRWGRLPGFTGQDGTEAGARIRTAINAAEVVNSGLAAYPLNLGPASPYASVPTGAARFRSAINGAADGVVNANVVPVNNADWPCAVRQFVWLHPSGAWCWGFFAGRHQHGDETSDGTVVRRANGVRKYASRGEVGEVVTIYSDVLDWATYQVLRTVRTSVQVYERQASGLYVPVLVEPGSYPGYKETDKTFRVDFTARYPVQVRQTQ